MIERDDGQRGERILICSHVRNTLISFYRQLRSSLRVVPKICILRIPVDHVIKLLSVLLQVLGYIIQ